MEAILGEFSELRAIYVAWSASEPGADWVANTGPTTWARDSESWRKAAASAWRFAGTREGAVEVPFEGRGGGVEAGGGGAGGKAISRSAAANGFVGGRSFTSKKSMARRRSWPVRCVSQA